MTADQVVADRCERTDLPVDQCAHCRGLDQPAKSETVGQPFEALYGGRCEDCDRGIREGDRIARVAADPGAYVHVRCPR